ncbi:MAG: HAD family hydrolase [Acidimicrobiia bacterium]
MVDAVLLDVGGVFHLPDPDRILGALARAGHDADRELLARAHYAGAAAFNIDVDANLEWHETWNSYNVGYARAVGVPDELLGEAVEHLMAEFATAALWTNVIPGSRDGLQALVDTGVKVGIVSNADGTVAVRLREAEVLQVGPGPGVEVGCVIDSGAVGVTKPDPAIFAIALDALGVAPDRTWYVGDMPAIDVVGARAAGLRPIVIDPFDVHGGLDCDRVQLLHEVAAMVVAARG